MKRKLKKAVLERAAMGVDIPSPKPPSMKDKLKYHAQEAADTAMRAHPAMKSLPSKMLKALLTVGKQVHRETMKRV